MAIGWIVKCISGPRLYRVYKTDTFQGKIYEANCLEGYSDNIIRSLGYALSFAWSLGALASPLIAYFLYRKGIVGSLDVVLYLFRLARIIVVVWVGTLCLRGIGRCANTDYLKFLAALEKAQKDRLALKIYDGDFDAWPVDFSWSDVVNSKDKCRVGTESSRSRTKAQGLLSFIRDLPVRTIGYLCIHSFGRSMMYPGAVKLLQAAVGPMLLEGRAKLMEQHRATRYKLATRDGNFIDSVFVDRRSNNLPQGKTLVLCCEGNAGFYEVGIMATPVDAQYSVLGWNHPGFAGSTGVPFPAQEQNAVDVVMQFAIHKLGFKPEDIIVYSWSIGAYTGSWCAMTYPDIKGLILDATFDDVVPLAASKMPSTIRGIVERTVADYFNLNNAEQTNKYTGPILMYRRTNDEVISTDINNRLGSNRANDLLTKVLRHRFPEIICDETAWVLREWLSGDRSHQKILYEEQHVDDVECERLLLKAIQDGDSYPMELGAGMPLDQRAQLLLYIAKRHMLDFNSTHCVPLPVAKFQEPWDIRKKLILSVAALLVALTTETLHRQQRLAVLRGNFTFGRSKATMVSGRGIDG